MRNKTASARRMDIFPARRLTEQPRMRTMPRARVDPPRAGGQSGHGRNTMPNETTSPLGIYNAHLEKGELAYQFSPAANRAVFFPRVLCPYTGSDTRGKN